MSEVEDYYQNQRLSGRQAFVGALDDDPDQAAEAMSLSQDTGVPPTAIYGDIDGFKRAHKAALGSSIISDNEYVADYLNSHPMAARVSNDDLGSLDDVSRSLAKDSAGSSFQRWLKSDSMSRSFMEGFGEQPFGQIAFQRPEDVTTGRPSDLEWAITHPLTASAIGALTMPVEGISRVTSGLLHMGYDGMSAVFGEKFAREMASIAEMSMMRGDIGVRAGGGGAMGPMARLEHNMELFKQVDRGMKTADVFTEAGEEPPPYIHPHIDEAKKIETKEDMGNLDEMFKAANQSVTRERSPELFAEFVRSHVGDREIGIDADAVRKLYGDRVPDNEDNLLGWIPGLADQLARSDLTGGDIRVPLADWLARADPDVAKTLHDDIRARDTGFTLNDTKIDAEPKEVIPEPVQAIRGAAGTEPMFMVGDRKLTIEKRPPRIEGKTGVIAADEFRLHDETGQKVGWLEVTPHEGGKKLYVDNIGGFESFGFGPNSFGPALTRSLIRQLKEHYPNVEQVGGFRISGAREKAGTERDVWIKVQPEDAYDAETHKEFKNILTNNWEHLSRTTRALFDVEGKGLAADTPLGQVVLQEARRLVPQAEVDVAHQVEMQGKPVRGAYIPNLRQIIVSLSNLDAPGTLRHESIHALRDLGLFSDDEWATLERASKDEDWIGRYDVERRWAGIKGARLPEESIAEAYRHWATDKAMSGLTPEIKTFFQRIQDFFENLRLKFNELIGADLTWEQIFEKIDSGEIGGREVMEEGEGEAAAQPADIFRRAANENRQLSEKELRRARSELNFKEFQDFQKELDNKIAARKGEEPSAMPEGEKPTGLYDRAKTLGVTQVHLDRMMRLIDKRNAEDFEASRRRAEVRQRRKSNKEWKERRTEIRDEVRQDLSQRPDLASDEFMTRSGLKLHPDFLSDDQKERLPKDYVQKKNGVAPDDIASHFGYASGDALVERLGMLTEDRKRAGMSQRNYFNRLVDVETDRRLNREFGDREQTILDEARDQATSETQLSLAHEETLAYALKAGVEPEFSKEDVRTMVKEAFDKLRVKDISTERSLMTAGRIGKKIEEAEAKGDWQEAYRLMQKREHSLVEAKLAKDYERNRRKFDRMTKTYTKNRIVPAVEQEYTNWIQDLLLRTGNRLSRSVQDLQENIARQTSTTLEDFIDEKEAHFMGMRQLDVPDFVQDPDFRTKLNDLSHYEFEGLRQGIRILDKAGRDEKSVNVGGENWDIAKTKSEMRKQLETFGFSVLKAFPEKSKFYALRMMAYGLTNMETLLNRWDRGNSMGVFNRVVIHPLVEAANGKSRLLRDIAQDLKQIDRPKPKELERLVDAPFPDPMTPDGQGRWDGFNRGNVLAMLQNAGNKSNWNVLARGYGMEPEALFKWLQKNVTKADVLRAQQLGDIFKKLVAQSDRVYERLTGATVEKIPLKSIEFSTSDGETFTVPGWYHPLDRDPIRASQWKTDPQTGQQVRTGTRRRESAYGDADYFHASTSNGYTKKRTGAIYPLNLDYNMVPTRMRQMAHDIHFREPLLNVEKIFGDKLFQEDVAKYYGREYAKGLMPYLRHLAGAESLSSENAKWGEAFFEKARQNIISTYIGFNPFTMAKHGPTAAWFSSKEVGAPEFFRAFTDTWFRANRGNVQKFIKDNSEEIQRRERHWQDTLAGQGNELSDKSTIREQVIDWGSKGVAKSDMASAMPTWLAAYQKYQGQGLPHGQAVTLADRAVRRAHGSTAETNLPPLVRSGGIANRYFTSVYGFFGTAMQRRIELAHQLNDTYKLGREGELRAAAKNIPGILNNFMTYVVWPTLVEEAVRGAVTQDQRNAWSYALSAGTMGLSSSVLYLRDLMYGLTTGHDPGAGLISSAMHDTANVARDIRRGRDALNKQHAGKTVEDALTLFGEATGRFPKTAAHAIRFGIDVATGQQKPKTPVEWMRGFAHGEAKRRVH